MARGFFSPCATVIKGALAREEESRASAKATIQESTI